jgi:5,10-methylenetetrahydrofolate reductase
MDTIPPKGTDLSGNFERIRNLKGRVDGVNAVDMPSAVMRMNALALSHLLLEKGFEPILQMTCRDRNRLSLQADLLGAAALGIENILILRGDEIELSDDPHAKPVFDVDSIDFLRAARGLEKGNDMIGKDLKGSPTFCLGAALDPFADPLEREIERMERKISAGAEFFQTQPVFDPDSFLDFMKKVNYVKTPIIAGIFLLKSAKMAQFVNKNVPGVTVPNEIIAEMENTDDIVEKSIEIAVRVIKSIKGSTKGIHIMTIGWEDKVSYILDTLRM